MELDRRGNTLLQVLVEAYLHGGQPVSSAAVAQRMPECSAATVRSAMAELELAGLLHQPHASAGRVPTERGLRVYLDGMVRPRLRPWDRARLNAAGQDGDPASFPAQLGGALAELAGQVVVVSVPRVLGTRLREVGLVRCASGRVLAYFVSPGGLVQQRLIELDSDVTADELQRIQNVLNARLGNRTLAEVRARLRRELAEAERSHDALVQRAMAIGAQLLPDGEDEVELCIEGTAHLLDQPEFTDLRQLRAVLRTLAERAALLRLVGCVLARASEAGGVQVMFGDEHGLPEAAELACFADTWHGDGAGTAISVLGPRRMNYGRMLPLVRHATDLYAQYWERL